MSYIPLAIGIKRATLPRLEGFLVKALAEKILVVLLTSVALRDDARHVRVYDMKTSLRMPVTSAVRR